MIFKHIAVCLIRPAVLERGFIEGEVGKKRPMDVCGCSTVLAVRQGPSSRLISSQLRIVFLREDQEDVEKGQTYSKSQKEINKMSGTF